MKYTQKPGETPAFTGIYQEYGGNFEVPNFCVIEVGDERLPPTKEKGHLWLWVEPYIPKK